MMESVFVIRGVGLNAYSSRIDSAMISRIEDYNPFTNANVYTEQRNT
jgi:hypothetical protein